MGGAVSSGRDNNELIDNLMTGGYIRSPSVERVFRVLDRADYMVPESRDQAYKDLAWRSGLLHLSAPCIYSEVMEALELRPGLSFLNLGSGTGYLSTLAGLILGSAGISHGVECYPAVIEYANKKLSQFIENSVTLDEYDFCMPKFYLGNALALAPLQSPYDRVYCGAGVLPKYENYFKQLVKVGGVLVMPLGDMLVQLRRTGADTWVSHSLLNVSFALLRGPTADTLTEPLKLDEQAPMSLQVLSRAVIRTNMRAGLLRRHPELREPPPRKPAVPRTYPRRICIPLNNETDVEGLNELHDLDPASGANEMNALLSLVLNMGQNRVAGSLRLDSIDDFDTPITSEDDDEDAEEDLDEEGDRDASANGAQGAGEGERAHEDEDEGRAASPAVDEPLRAARDPPGAVDPPDHPEPGTSDQDQKTTRPSEMEVFFEENMDSYWERLPERLSDYELSDEGGSSSSSDDDEQPRSGGGKRQKLDSGIGEGSASSGATPDKSEPKSDESDVAPSASSEEAPAGTDPPQGRVRRGKRGHWVISGRVSPRWSATRAAAESEPERADGEEEAEGEEVEGEAVRDGHCAGCTGGRRRRVRRGRDARRVRLSIAMKRGVKELPLPYALKKYVNLGRCFEF